MLNLIANTIALAALIVYAFADSVTVDAACITIILFILVRNLIRSFLKTKKKK